eukprot:364197-Chlamydomonas_euryale.AAC.29
MRMSLLAHKVDAFACGFQVGTLLTRPVYLPAGVAAHRGRCVCVGREDGNEVVSAAGAATLATHYP